jgi:glycosyltransferase involved in cell wall biosynthesis
MIAGLADSMLNSILAPILANESNLINVLRTTPGIPRSRVSYICPPILIRKNSFLSLIWKALTSLYLALSSNFSCIYVVHAFPHLYLGALTSYISRKPLVYMVIASRFEFSVHGPVIERLTIGLARRANRLIVSNVDIVEFLIKQGIAPTRIIKYQTLDLVDLKNYFPMDFEKSIHLVVLSRLVADKHIDIFINIVGRLKVSRPDIKAAIIGDGKLKENLEDYARSKGLTDNIRFYGFVSSVADVNKILNSAEIFVLNSSHEGGPFSIMEAMAAGLCCVSSNVGEVPNVIKNDINGFIIDKHNDEEAYVSTINELLNDRNRLQKIQQKAAQIKSSQKTSNLTRFWRSFILHIQDLKYE